MSRLRSLHASPRTRRRLLGVAGVLLAAATVALVIALVPRGKPFTSRFTTQPVKTAPETPRVPLAAADRREIAALLDRFVPAAVGRRDPGVAWDLAAPELRAGSSRAEWARGDVPAQPYPVRAGPTHDYFLLYSIRNQVAVELGLRPGPHSKVGNAAYIVTMKRLHGRWLVSGIYLRALYPPATGS